MRRLREAPGLPAKLPPGELHGGRRGPVPGVSARRPKFFGLPIGAVDEVARVPDNHPLPNMPEFLEGVINLRGEVLPVVDQRRRFGMPAVSGRGGQRLIVVRPSVIAPA